MHLSLSNKEMHSHWVSIILRMIENIIGGAITILNLGIPTDNWHKYKWNWSHSLKNTYKVKWNCDFRRVNEYNSTCICRSLQENCSISKWNWLQLLKIWLISTWNWCHPLVCEQKVHLSGWKKVVAWLNFFYSNRIDIEWLIILNYESEINCKGLYSILSYGATGTKDRWIIKNRSTSLHVPIIYLSISLHPIFCLLHPIGWRPNCCTYC